MRPTAITSCGMRRRCQRDVAACAVAFVALIIGAAQALQFEMQTQTKCIYEEINANVIVVGDYQAANRDNPGLPIYVDVKVKMFCESMGLSAPLLLPCCWQRQHTV